MFQIIENIGLVEDSRVAVNMPKLPHSMYPVSVVPVQSQNFKQLAAPSAANREEGMAPTGATAHIFH